VEAMERKSLFWRACDRAQICRAATHSALTVYKRQPATDSTPAIAIDRWRKAALRISINILRRDAHVVIGGGGVLEAAPDVETLVVGEFHDVADVIQPHEQVRAWRGAAPTRIVTLW